MQSISQPTHAAKMSLATVVILTCCSFVKLIMASESDAHEAVALKSVANWGSRSISHQQHFFDKNQTSSSGDHRFNEIRAQRNKCSTAERDLDECSAQLIGLGQSGAAGLQYPNSIQELNSVYCPKFRETVGCVKNATECYKPFEKQIINWILGSTRRMNYKRCKSEGEKQKFLKLTNSCFHTMRHSMDKCMGQYINHLDAIAESDARIERLSQDDIQIQLACCANRRFKQCIMKSARLECKAPSGSLEKLRRTNSLSSNRATRKHFSRAIKDTMDDLTATLDGMALTGPEFICNGVDEKFCATKFDGRFKSALSRHKSIVPAMIKIYSNK